jgi:cysteine-rich repeat protein
VLADPATVVDRRALGAIADGVVLPSEYSGATTGINAGFGGRIGSGTTYGVEGTLLGAVTFGLNGSAASPCAASDAIVIYIDSRPGGFASTAGFSDAGDKHRAAISAMGTMGAGRADITFAPGFEADYAIAFDTTFVGLWELANGAPHTFVKSLTAVGDFGLSCNHELGGLTVTDLNVALGGTFRYVITLLNPLDGGGAFRSNELHGVAPSTVPGGNPGVAPITLAAGDFNTFDSLSLVINEVDADTPGDDALEFVELYDGGAGNVALDGLALVFWNGSNDQSYRSFDLDTHSTSATGYFVAGNDLVPGRDVVTPNDGLQQGQDAVALHISDGALPNGTAVTGANLVDAVVYDTNDADDPVLLATLTPGQPQVNESEHGLSATESQQRCSGGPLTTTGFRVGAPPTPDGANFCPVCGNGTIESGEFCDDTDGNDTVGCNNACSACAVNYFGPNCATLCIAATTCTGNGVCDATGACDCNDGFHSSDCSTTQCGDGFAVVGEACDGDGLGLGGETATCDDDCTDVECGDGTQNATAGEGCDDGDADNDDDCPDGVNGTCEPAACGDGFADGEGAATEACDGDGAGTAGPTATCDADCTAATCGDMTVNNLAGETCDAGMRTATCDVDCTAVSCGDGVVNMANGEMCDGNGAGLGGETALCDDDCTQATCGDMHVNGAAMEDCDEGGEAADCDDDCTDVVCGDDNENAAAGEECDDGNTDPGDGCDADCLEEGTGGMGGMGGSEGGMGGSMGGAGGMGGSGATGNNGGSGAVGGTPGVGNTGGDENAAEGGCSCVTAGRATDGDERAFAFLALAAALALRTARPSRRRR